VIRFLLSAWKEEKKKEKSRKNLCSWPKIIQMKGKKMAQCYDYHERAAAGVRGLVGLPVSLPAIDLITARRISLRPSIHLF